MMNEAEPEIVIPAEEEEIIIPPATDEEEIAVAPAGSTPTNTTKPARTGNGAHERKPNLVLVSLVYAALLAVAIVIPVVLINKSKPNSVIPEPEPEPVVARCQKSEVLISSEGECETMAFIDPKLLDDGSTGPSGLNFSVEPAGPYVVGGDAIQVNLTVATTDGSSLTDSCIATVRVLEDGTPWQQSPTSGNLYRINPCSTSTFAQSREQQGPICSQTPHLATITSRNENNFIKSIVYDHSLLTNNAPVWIGAFQTPGSSDKDGWNWVTDETFYVYDWKGGEPARDEDECATSGVVEDNGEIRWYGRSCDEEYGYIEEIDAVNIVVDNDGVECDTGVPEVWLDMNSCSRLIQPGIDSCQTESSASPESCIDGFLQGLVDGGSIAMADKAAIQACKTENSPPTAVCKDFVEVTTSCSDLFYHNSTAASMFDGGSFDSDSSDDLPLTLTWEISAPSISIDFFFIGVHDITLTVIDYRGASAQCATKLVVKEADPTIGNWQQFGDNYYRLHSCPTTWESARFFLKENECAGDLATPLSAEENNFLVESFGGFRHWLGGYQPEGSTEPAGGWTWVNGDIAFGYTNWANNRPNNCCEGALLGPTEDCVGFRDEPGNANAVEANRGKWEDRHCGNIFQARTYIEQINATALEQCGGV